MYMLVTLDPRDERPLYLQIVDQVRRALLDGTLRAEDPLPSVRELAGQLVVNPRTVSQAYRELEGEGVIYVRRGRAPSWRPPITRTAVSDAPSSAGWPSARWSRRGATGSGWRSSSR
jgi:DNA-binding transcriptional MocR family regulator